MKVPASSANGRKLRLRGRGIPGSKANAEAGDLYAVLNVVLPPADTDQARAAYRHMAQELAFDPRAGTETQP
jgi:curved DNA-binding protein